MTTLLEPRLKEIKISNNLSIRDNEAALAFKHFITPEETWANKFKNLKKFILVWNGINDIMDCDALLERCSLNRLDSLNLKLIIYTDDQHVLVSNISSSIIPRPNLKQLNFIRRNSVPNNILINYIMKKFPELDYLSF